MIIDILEQPLNAFVISQSTLFWPYLLSALLVAIGVSAITAYVAQQNMVGILADLFSKRIWWAPSSKADYLYFVVNSMLYGSLIAPLMIGGIDVGIGVQSLLIELYGEGPDMGWTAHTARVLYTICFFVAYDLGRFLAHWGQHKIDLLWQFHKVHHSAEVLTPITSFRVHPVDLFIMGLGGNLFGGIATGLFFYLSAGDITIATFLGTHLLIAVYNLIGNLRHSHVWLDYGVLGYLIVSPAQHQIHHSTSPQHMGNNFGFALAVWDYLFGTLYVPKEKETFAMGLGDGTDGTWHTIGKLYTRPFVLAVRILGGGKSKDVV